MGPETWHINAQREIWSDAIAIRVGLKSESGFAVATGAVFVQIEPGEMTHPLLRLPFDAAQRLMDELWQAGCRPSQSVGSAGQVEAIKYHLEDMRKLVFKEGSNGA
jgi:hypothetical protein